jgi:hypothetical protein
MSGDERELRGSASSLGIDQIFSNLVMQLPIRDVPTLAEELSVSEQVTRNILKAMNSVNPTLRGYILVPGYSPLKSNTPDSATSRKSGLRDEGAQPTVNDSSPPTKKRDVQVSPSIQVAQLIPNLRLMQMVDKKGKGKQRQETESSEEDTRSRQRGTLKARGGSTAQVCAPHYLQ